MLKQERQAYILHQVNLHNQVLSANLSLDLNVSEDTVRRDLQELADNGKIIKVHGGALSLSFNDFHYPSTNVYAHSQKKLIARKAISLISNDMFVMTTGGTTLIELAKAPLPHGLEDVSNVQLVPAFMLSELRAAFQIGFVIFLPFLLIDLIVSSVLMALGMMMMPPTTVALPLKVLVFVLVDGWGLLLRALVGSFH